jgi:enolase-phosphatase E1
VSPLDERRVECLLLDIEGTTTPVEFVYEALFPYARARVNAFLRANAEEIATLRVERASDVQQGLNPPCWDDNAPESSLDSAAAYVQWLMDEDRKSTALKALQGKIWEAGYRSGELQGEVYADVLPAFLRWRQKRKTICIFSSGSVLAQKLLFQTTRSGDLRPFITAYFDTTTGKKVQPESYRRIAMELGQAPANISFISDVTAELDAAHASGLRTVLCVRPGRSIPNHVTHPVIQTFDVLLP